VHFSTTCFGPYKLYTNICCVRRFLYLLIDTRATGCINQLTIKNSRVIQNKRRGMVIVSVLLLHDNVCLYTAARTRALLDHFNRELFDDHPHHSPDLAPNHCHLFTYLKKWVESQCFNNNEELMEGVKIWLSHGQQTSLTGAYKNFCNLVPSLTSASILAVTTLRSNLSM
jgi:hypothetical protein